ncbi:hypothetical protein H2248_004228 [Termitomyces sp. 'cryptogamus']|nr:hypothetical protein H2248_004228 [Termitomyces sp. 'cryptogamus']
MTVDKTRDIIKKLIHIESNISMGISFPLQKQKIDSDCFPSPYNMLIFAQADYITGLGVVSTPELTIILKAFEDQHPEFVATICSLTFQNSPEAPPVVIDLIKKCFCDSKVIVLHVTETSPLPHNRAMSEILDNLLVKFIEVKRSPANGGNFCSWNVYLHKSSLNDNNHIQLIQLMRACNFPIATFGFGIPLKGKDTLSCISCWLGHKPPTPLTTVFTGSYSDVQGTINPYQALPRSRGRSRGFEGRACLGYKHGGRGF